MKTFKDIFSDISYKYWYIVLPLFLFLAFISVRASKNLVLRLSFFDELPSDHPQVKRFNYVSQNYGGTDLLFVAIQSDNLTELKRCAQSYERELRMLPEIKSVRGKLDVSFFKKHALYFLEDERLKELKDFIARRTEDFSSMFENLEFANFIKNWSTTMENEIVEREDVGDEKDFVKAVSNFREWIKEIEKSLSSGEVDREKYKRILRKVFLLGTTGMGEEYSADEEYLLSEDSSTLLITAVPTKPSDNYLFDRIIYKKATGIRENLGKTECKNAKILLGGNYIVLAEQEMYVLNDMKRTNIVGYIGIMSVFLIIFRGIFSLLVVGLSVALGLILVFGFIMLSLGYVTITASLFGPFLMGMGIDYSVYVLSRWREFVDAGEDIKKSVKKSVIENFSPVLASALTTSAAFYSLCIAEHKGAKIMGLISGTGIIIYFFTMLTFTPSLIMLLRRFLYREKPKGTEKLFYGLSDFIANRPFHILGVAVLLISLSAFKLKNFGFEYNLRKLLPKMPSIQTEEIVVEKFRRGKDYSVLLGRDLQDVRNKTKELQSFDTVGKVESIASFYPEDMNSKRSLVFKINQIVKDVKSGEIPSDGWVYPVELSTAFYSMKRVADAMVELSVLSGAFEGEKESKALRKDVENLIDWFSSRDQNDKMNISSLQTVNAEIVKEFLGDLKTSSESSGFKLEELPEDMKDFYIGKDGSFIIFSYPSKPIWEDERFIRKNVEQMKSVDRDSFGVGVLYLSITDRVKLDFKRALFLTSFVVLFIVILTFKSVKWGVFSLVPVSLGLLSTAGLMTLLRLKIHYMNMGALSVIIGAGIDYGIHITHRFREEGDIRKAVIGTGRAIFIAAVTTAVGFGSMILAVFPGLRHFGETLSLGIIISLIFSIIIAPAIVGSKKQRRGGNDRCSLSTE